MGPSARKEIGPQLPGWIIKYSTSQGSVGSSGRWVLVSLHQCKLHPCPVLLVRQIFFFHIISLFIRCRAQNKHRTTHLLWLRNKKKYRLSVGLPARSKSHHLLLQCAQKMICALVDTAAKEDWVLRSCVQCKGPQKESFGRVQSRVKRSSSLTITEKKHLRPSHSC